jgi:SAM-dependent methyltransferase
LDVQTSKAGQHTLLLVAELSTGEVRSEQRNDRGSEFGVWLLTTIATVVGSIDAVTGGMEDGPQTWHHGLVAAWWGEFNDDFRLHEIFFYHAHIERSGQPLLDAGCGAGRLLLPYLRAGPDVDGCDQSADMIEVCREKVAIEGFEPNLYVQAMHAIDLPRMDRTILVVGSFGLGSHRERDMQALVRMREHLEPGGTVLIDIDVPYVDPGHWEYWLKEERATLPDVAVSPGPRRRAADGSEYAMSSRLVAVEPLDQRVTMEAHIQRWPQLRPKRQM